MHQRAPNFLPLRLVSDRQTSSHIGRGEAGTQGGEYRRIDGAGAIPSFWHPRISRFHEHWRSIHHGRDLPCRHDFDPMRIYDLLPYVWLLDVAQNPFRLRYRLVGTRIVLTIGRDLTGIFLDEAHPHIARNPHLLDHFRIVIESRKPNWRRGPARLWPHEHFGEIEKLVVPLSSNGEPVDILAVMTVLYDLDGNDA